MKPNSLWQDFYAAAMLELDRAALPGKIEAAQAAIHEAMEESKRSDKAANPAEIQSMTDALRNLRTLQRVEFKTSDIPTSTTTASQGQSLAEG
jgi:ribosome maturation protein Sdo1